MKLEIQIKYFDTYTKSMKVFSTKGTGEFFMVPTNPYNREGRRGPQNLRVDAALAGGPDGKIFTIEDDKPQIDFKIKKVHYNDPVTVVLWEDGTKTIVTASEEPFDKEKGLAMAIAKKAMGNQGNYFNAFKKWCQDEV